MNIIRLSLNYIGFILLLSLYNLGMILTRNQLIKKNNISLSFIYSFVLMLFIIPEIVLYYQSKEIETKEEFKSSLLRRRRFPIVAAKHNKHWPQKLLFLTILGLLSTITPLLEFQFGYWEYPSIYNPIIIASLIFTWLFSFIFVRKPMHLHHISALILMIIMRIIYLVVYREVFISLALGLATVWWLYTLLALIFAISLSSREVIEKYLMDVCFMSPFLILFIEGCISSCINLVIYFALQNVDYSQYNFVLKLFCQFSTWPYIEEELEWIFNNTEKLILFICLLVLICVVNVFRTYINKSVDSSNRYFADSLTELYNYTLFIFLSKNKFPFKVTDLINICAVLFGCLVYNETILLYFWGLANNTRIEIEKRDKEDFLLLSASADLYEKNETDSN